MALSDITSSTKTYTVVRNDTFSEIAQKCIQVGMPGYSGLSVYNAGINKLKSFNPDIENINLIYVGQKIVLQGTPASKSYAKAQRPKITSFGLSAKTDDTIFATWAWDKSSQTENYKILWKYGKGDGIGYVGTDSTTTYKYSTFQRPDDTVTHVTFQVKPVSKKKGEKGTYFTADWSTKQTYYFKNNPPKVPPMITESNVTQPEDWKEKLLNLVVGKSIKLKYTISMKFADSDIEAGSGLYLNAHAIQLQVLKGDNRSVYKSTTMEISRDSKTRGECSTTVDLGSGYSYKFRVRSYNKNLNEYSAWSDVSTYQVDIPGVSAGIDKLYISGKDASAGTYTACLTWFEADGNVKNYEIQYTTNKDYFDNNPDGVSTTTRETTASCAYITGLEKGKEYFFRIRSVGESVETPWSDSKSLLIGEKPAVPTVWTMSNIYSVGEQITFYWAHNTSDGSLEDWADLDISINGERYIVNNGVLEKTTNPTEYTRVIAQRDEYNNPIGGTSSCTISTSQFTSDFEIRWKVRTKSLANDPSEWSETRVVKVYVSPEISLVVTDNTGSDTVDILQSFPINVSVSPDSGVTQEVVSYHIAIVAVNSYETTDELGNFKMVNSNSAVFSKFYEPAEDNTLTTVISAGDVNLDNNQSYKIICTAAFSSGLTGEDSATFTVEWTDAEYICNAEIEYNADTYSAIIHPYCEEYTGESDSTTGEGITDLVNTVTLSLYRREYDGSFTELATDLPNRDGVYVTDPHPALDFARYRVVAKDTETGAISYYDVPGFDIGEKAIIIQWDEVWSTFNQKDGEEIEDPAWSGSLLRLPYNIDVSDNYDKDVELIDYIGRDDPVAYYGTSKNHSSTWSTEIPKTDIDTLYALRRLARWMGNVYVREPSGSGYYANIKVSFSQTHCELTIPISISVTRVEGE